MDETYAIAYLRISDPIQLKGGGLADQEKAIIDHIRDKGWLVYKNKVFKEVYTGTTSLRPVYTTLKQEIRENKGVVKFFVIKVLDRASREGSPEYFKMKDELFELGVELRDAQGIIQPVANTLVHRGVGYKWSHRSPSRITEAILSEVANQEHSNILTRMVGSSVERVETGYKVRGANEGYKNKKVIDREGRIKYIQEPDPERAHFMRMIFDLSAEGFYTDNEIVAKINDAGFKTKIKQRWNSERTKVISHTGGLPLTVKQMQAYRKRPIYCGINTENWGTITKRRIITKTVYDGLVSIEKFNIANKGRVFIRELESGEIEILYNHKEEKSNIPFVKKRQKFRKDFIFKNAILCPECKKPFLASAPKNKLSNPYPEYHCARNHNRVAVPKKELEYNVMKYLNRISFKDEYISVFKKTTIFKFQEERKKNNKNQVKINEYLLELQKKQLDVYETIKSTKSEKLRSKYEQEYEELDYKIEKSQHERNKLEISEDELDDFLATAKILMEHPAEMLVDVDSYDEQMSLYKIFFESLPTYKEIVSGTPKISLFFKLKEENSEVNDGISELVTLRGIEPRLPP